MTRTSVALKKLEAERAELAKKIKDGKAGRIDQAEAQLADMDRRLAGMMGVTVEQLGKMRR